MQKKLCARWRQVEYCLRNSCAEVCFLALPPRATGNWQLAGERLRRQVQRISLRAKQTTTPNQKKRHKRRELPDLCTGSNYVQRPLSGAKAEPKRSSGRVKKHQHRFQRKRCLWGSTCSPNDQVALDHSMSRANASGHPS